MLYQRDLRVLKNKDTPLKHLFVQDQKLRSIAPKLNIHYSSHEIIQAINCSLNKFAPYAQTKSFENQGWFNKTPKKLIGKRHRASKKFKNDPSELSKGKNNTTKIEVAKAIRNCKNQFLEKLGRSNFNIKAPFLMQPETLSITKNMNSISIRHVFWLFATFS